MSKQTNKQTKATGFINSIRVNPDLYTGQCGVLVSFNDQVIGLDVDHPEDHVLPPSSLQDRQ